MNLQDAELAQLADMVAERIMLRLKPDPDEVLNRKQVAEFLNLSRWTVQKLEKDGVLEFVKGRISKKEVIRNFRGGKS